MNKQDTIRVLRVYEFVGPRSLVEAQVAKSIHGEKVVGNGVVIKGATIGTYPEILLIDTIEDPPPVDSTVPAATKEAEYWIIKATSMTGASYLKASTVAQSGYTQAGADQAARFSTEQEAQQVLDRMGQLVPGHLTLSLIPVY